MRSLCLIIGLLAIWGLLAWGNIAFFNLSNDDYQERMESNYLINRYEGRLLLNQAEYTEFKKSLLSDEVEINKLDVYGSADVLVIYDIALPQNNEIPFVSEPESQRWYYEISRFYDYFAFTLVIVLSVVLGAFLSVCACGILGYYK